MSTQEWHLKDLLTTPGHPYSGVGASPNTELLRPGCSKDQDDTDIRTPKKGRSSSELDQMLGKLVTDSTAPIFHRFEATDLLVRLAIGPRYRPADDIDAATSRHARIVLSDAARFLDQVMASKNSRARTRLHAASLASLVTQVLLS